MHYSETAVSMRATWKRLNWNPFSSRNLPLSKWKHFVEMELFFCKFSLKNLSVAFLNSTSSSRLSPENLSSFKAAATPYAAQQLTPSHGGDLRAFKQRASLSNRVPSCPGFCGQRWSLEFCSKSVQKPNEKYQLPTPTPSPPPKKGKKKITSLTHCHIIKCFISHLSGTSSNVASSLKTFN